MKTNRIYLAFVVLFFSSCAMHNGLTYNSNTHNTEVVLSKKNFKVVARVKGESKATYILGFGGLSKNALIAEAKEDMLSKADIIGGSKAIINETVEIKNSFYLIVWENKVTVSANIIEFYNDESEVKTTDLNKKPIVEPQILKNDGISETSVKNEKVEVSKTENKSFKVGDKVKFNDDTSNDINYGKIVELKEKSVVIELLQFGQLVRVEKKNNEVWLRK